VDFVGNIILLEYSILGGRGNMKIRKMISALLLVVMLLSISACSKIVDKVAEKGVEKLVENTTGAEVDINKDGTTIEANGGSVQAGEDLKWPEDAMGELPAPKAKITFIMVDDASKGGTVAFTELELDDARKYIDKLKEMGYKDGMNVEDSDGVFFGGTTDKGSQVNFTYNLSNKEGSMTYATGK
jgi:hypothetical protein